MSTPANIVQQMRSALAITLPDMDTTVGTPMRKMLDVVAERIAEGYTDSYLLEYAYDLDAKAGSDLDDFVALFGRTRRAATRATGSVTFERQDPADRTIYIPPGSQLATTDDPPVSFIVSTPAIIPRGDTSVTVPVQAVEGGTSGNVAPNSIIRSVTKLDGFSSLSNLTALSGGRDEEDDAALRARFKRTIFRNLAGTEQMYLGVALEDEDVFQAIVLGSSRRFREQIDVVAGEAASTIANASYIYPGTSTLGPNIDAGEILIPGTAYTFDHNSLPPVVDVVDSGLMPDGIYDLEFDYVSNASRNDPEEGISNRVDVYAGGQRPEEVSETTSFMGNRVFSDDPNETYYTGDFLRPDETTPDAGNFFIPFAFAPVMDPAPMGTIVVNGESFTKGEDFFLVNDITEWGGSPRSRSGIEWVSEINGATEDPPDFSQMDLDYLYNAIPRDVQRALEEWRIVTDDVLVHQARRLLLNLHFAVILESGFSAENVREDLREALQDLFANIGFEGVLQVSDLLTEAGQVTGISAVRFLTSDDDATEYAIQRIDEAESQIQETYDNGGTPSRAVDVFSADNEIPVLNDVFISVRASNTFGAV